MEANEIMTNEEVTEVAEEIVTKESGKLKTAAIGGLAVLFGGLAVQYAIIPVLAKLKAKKQTEKRIKSSADEPVTEDSEILKGFVED